MVNEDTDTLGEGGDVLTTPNRQLNREPIQRAQDPTHPGALMSVPDITAGARSFLELCVERGQRSGRAARLRVGGIRRCRQNLATAVQG